MLNVNGGSIFKMTSSNDNICFVFKEVEFSNYKLASVWGFYQKAYLIIVSLSVVTIKQEVYFGSY